METTAPEVLTSDHFHFLPPVFTVHWHKWIWFPWRIVPVDIKGLPFSLGLCLAFFPPQSCECSLTLAKSIWVCQATGLGNSLPFQSVSWALGTFLFFPHSGRCYYSLCDRWGSWVSGKGWTWSKFWQLLKPKKAAKRKLPFFWERKCQSLGLCWFHLPLLRSGTSPVSSEGWRKGSRSCRTGEHGHSQGWKLRETANSGILRKEIDRRWQRAQARLCKATFCPQPGQN